MRIQEAIKSGKRFRELEYHKDWIISSHMKNVWFHRDQILSENWEIEEEKIEITKFQLINAIASAAKKRAVEREYKTLIHTPYGADTIDCMYGAELLVEMHKFLLEELGF